jgi:hypothetical protein
VDSLRTPTGNEPLEYKVEGLVEGSKVQFRVIAVNKGGESEPSDPSPTHTVKHRKCKCPAPPPPPPFVKQHIG